MASASPSGAAPTTQPSPSPATPHAGGGGGGGRDEEEEEAHGGDYERDGGELTAEEMELERRAMFKYVAAACVSQRVYRRGALKPLQPKG